jgi:hypothetical protein
LIVERTGFQSSQMLDMLVVGSCINGVGIARDAAGLSLSVQQDLGGAGAAAVHLGLFCSASHSIEPGCHTVWAGCGWRRGSASSAASRR